jgi:hypothetical protein
MAGISAFGAYVPWLRLSRQAIAQYWGGRGTPGEKAMANYDEDSITMGVAAGIDALGALARDTIDGVYFATTTAPYKEKQSAQVIATALDLRRDVYTADFTEPTAMAPMPLPLRSPTPLSKPAKTCNVACANTSRPSTPWRTTKSTRVFGSCSPAKGRGGRPWEPRPVLPGVTAMPSSASW